MIFKDFCVLVLWANVVSALEGLKRNGGSDERSEQVALGHILAKIQYLTKFQRIRLLSVVDQFLTFSSYLIK